MTATRKVRIFAREKNCPELITISLIIIPISTFRGQCETPKSRLPFKALRVNNAGLPFGSCAVLTPPPADESISVLMGLLWRRTCVRMPGAIWTHSRSLYEVSIDRTARILNFCEGGDHRTRRIRRPGRSGRDRTQPEGRRNRDERFWSTYSMNDEQQRSRQWVEQ